MLNHSLNRLATGRCNYIDPLLRWPIFALLCCGCGPSGDHATGENAQLKQQVDELKADNAKLRSERDAEHEKTKADLAACGEENQRLQQQLAALTGAKGISIEEQQRLLDERKAALEHQETELVAQKKRQQGELANLREEIVRREKDLTAKEAEFYDRTNMSMQEIGKAIQIAKEHDNTLAEKDAAVAHDRRMSAVAALTVPLLAVFACWMFLRHLHAKRQATLLTKAIEKLPPEQGTSLIVETLGRKAQIEDGRKRGSKAGE